MAKRGTRIARALTIVGLLVGIVVAGAVAVVDQGDAAAVPRAPAVIPARTSIDRLTAVARQRYSIEVHGAAVHRQMRRIGTDRGLIAALQAGNLGRARAYARSKFNAIWFKSHVSQMRILRGGKVVIEDGVPFCVAPSQMTIRGSRGQNLGTLQVSIQDEIGFVRYMHRNYPVDVVVQGRGAAHLKTSLANENPGVLRGMRLPNTGVTTIAGRHYNVRSFSQTALGGEPVKIWILAPA